MLNLRQKQRSSFSAFSPLRSLPSLTDHMRYPLMQLHRNYLYNIKDENIVEDAAKALLRVFKEPVCFDGPLSESDAEF